jgi:hypothetical protein
MLVKAAGQEKELSNAEFQIRIFFEYFTYNQVTFNFGGAPVVLTGADIVAAFAADGLPFTPGKLCMHGQGAARGLKSNAAPPSLNPRTCRA